MHHPHFSSALDWQLTLDGAQAAARDAHKRIMLVIGRATCNGTRNLVERTLAKEELESFTPEKFTLAYGDADDPALARVIAELPVKAPTPLVVYLTAEARVLASTAGGRPPAVLLNDMLNATSKQ